MGHGQEERFACANQGSSYYDRPVKQASYHKLIMPLLYPSLRRGGSSVHASGGSARSEIGSLYQDYSIVRIFL